MVTKEELKKSPDKQLSDDELGKVAGGKYGDVEYTETYTAKCPYCNHIAKRVRRSIEGVGLEVDSEDQCTCGAQITWLLTISKADFIKGDSIREVSISYTRED